MSNFWRSLDLPLIKCKIELDLSCSRKCLTSEISKTAAVAANSPNPVRDETKTDSAISQMNNAELYVPVVTLYINDNIN